MIPKPHTSYLLVRDVASPFKVSPLIPLDVADGFSKYHWSYVVAVSDLTKFQVGDLVYSQKQTGDLLLVDDQEEWELLHESQVKCSLSGVENPVFTNAGAKEVAASLARVQAKIDQVKAAQQAERAKAAGIVTG